MPRRVPLRDLRTGKLTGEYTIPVRDYCGPPPLGRGWKMLLPPAVSGLLREALAPAARAIVNRGVDDGDPVSLAVRCVCECLIQLQTGRMVPAELSSVLIPLLKKTSPPGQAVPDETTDPGSKPMFFDEPRVAGGKLDV